MKFVSLLLFLATIQCTAFGQSIKGRVFGNQSGKLLKDAVVSIDENIKSTTTNQTGQFSIKVSRGEHRVEVSAQGFVTYRTVIRVGAADYTLNVAMRVTSNLTKEETEVGSRGISTRTYTETPVAIDNFKIEQFANAFGQFDLSQLLHFLAPSFNSNRQSGSDGADHVDPTVLRGLGQDQVLILVNGKRRHQASLVYLFGTTGRGNSPTDLNTIPIGAIDRIEILRDGASAQYGSDAIAGVINIVLKSSTNGLNLNVNHGVYNKDGFTQNYSLGYGAALKNDGFINITADYLQRNRIFRPADDQIYTEVPRLKFGDTNQKNYSLYLNSEIPTNKKKQTFLYAFGGTQFRKTDAQSWTYTADNERNIKAIYPDGFEPRILSDILDGTISVGLRTKKTGAWNLDINNTYGYNQMHYFVANTLNASLGVSSPTSFDAGGFGLQQNVTGVHLTRQFKNGLKNTNVAFGSEIRAENYWIFAGEDSSWKKYANSDDLPGGAQTFPGLRPENELVAKRTNFGAYADVETDLSRSLLVAAAARFERYSDFGNTLNGKIAFRLKLNDAFALRASASTGFRAPSLAQSHFNAIYNDVVDGVSFEKILAGNNGSITNALGVPPLKQETAVNYSLGAVLKNNRNFTLTIDGYYVKVRNRILLTGDFTEDDPQIGSTLKNLDVKSALFFTNALSTTNYGVDVVGSIFTELGEKSKLETLISLNYNKIDLGDVNTTATLTSKEENYFSARDRSFVTSAAPNYKFNLTFVYQRQKVYANLRFVGFSEVKIASHEQDLQGEYTQYIYQSRIVSDASIGFPIFKSLQFVAGCSNMLDLYPTRQNPAYTETGGMYEAVQMGFGGRVFFTKIKINL
jgi:iron complex outermembrane recepter protein